MGTTLSIADNFTKTRQPNVTVVGPNSKYVYIKHSFGTNGAGEHSLAAVGSTGKTAAVGVQKIQKHAVLVLLAAVPANELGVDAHRFVVGRVLVFATHKETAVLQGPPAFTHVVPGTVMVVGRGTLHTTHSGSVLLCGPG